MDIPDYQTLMLPLLKQINTGSEYRFRDLVELISKDFDLSDDQRSEMLPSGKQPIINNRVGWARTYMLKAGLLEAPKRGTIRITDRGIKVLSDMPNSINVKFLEQFPEFIEFRRRKNKKDSKAETSKQLSLATPEEFLEAAYQSLNNDLASGILAQTKEFTALFFERLVIDLLVKMGYGGSRKEAGQAIGKSGDGGIDGIINEDRLGLDVIYIQAKRWDENTIGRPEIQKFAGALQGRRARKGIFITTSTFSKEAKEFVRNIESNIILIDGDQLADLMIEHDIGVSSVSEFKVKRIDLDYFIEE